MAEWTPDLATSDKPRYLAIAEAIVPRTYRPILVLAPESPS